MINVKTDVVNNTKYDDWLLSIKILTFHWNQVESLFNTKTKKGNCGTITFFRL